MKSYTDVRREITERAPIEKPKRTDYRCAAHGCPNTGTFGDEGEQKRGKCYFHWREEEPTKWPAITQRILENFDEMRNWGEFSPERQAMHRARSQAWAERMRTL